jgi:hypothetical protein
MELVSSGEEESLLMRMTPNNVPDMSRVDMLAECPLDHPFFVKDKGRKDRAEDQAGLRIRIRRACFWASWIRIC